MKALFVSPFFVDILLFPFAHTHICIILVIWVFCCLVVCTSHIPEGWSCWTFPDWDILVLWWANLIQPPDSNVSGWYPHNPFIYLIIFLSMMNLAGLELFFSQAIFVTCLENVINFQVSQNLGGKKHKSSCLYCPVISEKHLFTCLIMFFSDYFLIFFVIYQLNCIRTITLFAFLILLHFLIALSFPQVYVVDVSK